MIYKRREESTEVIGSISIELGLQNHKVENIANYKDSSKNAVDYKVEVEIDIL